MRNWRNCGSAIQGLRAFGPIFLRPTLARYIGHRRWPRVQQGADDGLELFLGDLEGFSHGTIIRLKWRFHLRFTRVRYTIRLGGECGIRTRERYFGTREKLPYFARQK